MKQEDAKAEILREFRALPEDQRKSKSDRLPFAMQMYQKYDFKYSGDRYQIIMAWLSRESPLDIF